MKIIFTEGIFTGLTMGDFQKICAGIFILSLISGHVLFKKNKKSNGGSSSFNSCMLAILPVMIVTLTFIIYDAPVQVVNTSTGNTVQAKNMAEGNKILKFIKEQEDAAFLEDAARELYK